MAQVEADSSGLGHTGSVPIGLSQDHTIHEAEPHLRDEARVRGGQLACPVLAMRPSKVLGKAASSRDPESHGLG